MGAIEVIDVADNAALQRAASEAIQATKSPDPFAPVTLVTDSAAQAWALRRQLAEACAPGSGVVNVRAVTLAELMSELARRVGLISPASTDPLLAASVVGGLLRADTGPLSASADHPETALLLASLSEELTWCDVDDTSAILDSAGVSLTARAAIEFVARTRSAMSGALGISTWHDVSSAVVARVTGDPMLASYLGSIVVVSARVPAPTRVVFDALAAHTHVVHIRVTPLAAPIAARVLDFPDPATEASFAVRCAADAIAKGSNPGSLAILYSTDLPYARLLERALDDAGIDWHGPTGQTLRSSTVARCLFALTDLAAGRTMDGSGITRPLLMRLLGLGHLTGGPEPVSSGPTRALIRQEGLFGDARTWLGHLDAIATPAVTESETEDSDEAKPRHAGSLEPNVRPLAALIRSLDLAVGEITSAATWSELGGRLWSTLEALHLQGVWWTVRPEDTATAEAVRGLLLEQFPAIDSLGAHAPQPSAADAAQMLDRTLAARRGRHGASSIGIHVGPVSSSRALVFDQIILVGASEGLLPPVRGEQPLLPDAARLLLRRNPDDLPTSSEIEGFTASDVRAIAGSAGSCIALLSRGALPGRAVGLPSRYLPSGRADRVYSTRASLTREPAPIAAGDIAERLALSSSIPDPALLPRIASIAAWASPSPGPYFGDLGIEAGVWSLHDIDLSASAIEQFLHCPYHFFVQRILRFSTDEFADTLETIAPNDIGTLLHSAFEEFVNQSRTMGTLPAAGQPWPTSALTDLSQIMNLKVDAAIAKGLTGWRPAWEKSYERVMASLPAFLDVDATEVRAAPPTAPAAAEQGFGFEGDPIVEFRVTNDVVVRLRGSIDRIDLSDDGCSVGVVDYKSSRAKGFEEKLGKPKKDGTQREREKVQDLVYDAAARVLYPEAEHIDVHFIFVPNAGEYPEVVTPQHDLDRENVLRDLLLRLESAGETGSFPPTPQGSRDYCPVCKRLGRRALIISGKAESEEEEEQA
ncbi:MAG: PD-(D/E)XK nuclease family protein [Candidatus Nanopelagicales bacterium]